LSAPPSCWLRSCSASGSLECMEAFPAHSNSAILCLWLSSLTTSHVGDRNWAKHGSACRFTGCVPCSHRVFFQPSLILQGTAPVLSTYLSLPKAHGFQLCRHAPQTLGNFSQSWSCVHFRVPLFTPPAACFWIQAPLGLQFDLNNCSFTFFHAAWSMLDYFFKYNVTAISSGIQDFSSLFSSIVLIHFGNAIVSNQVSEVRSTASSGNYSSIHPRIVAFIQISLLGFVIIGWIPVRRLFFLGLILRQQFQSITNSLTDVAWQPFFGNPHSSSTREAPILTMKRILGCSIFL